MVIIGKTQSKLSWKSRELAHATRKGQKNLALSGVARAKNQM
jgi:hypothetical protein